MLYVKKIIDKAICPKKGSSTAAGYDLFSVEDLVIPAKGKGLVKTGISIACPQGSYARIAPRSGLALKHFIDVGAGVIDEDYRGEIGVLLFNFSDVEFKVNYGDRVAQMIIEYVVPTEIKEIDNLSSTERGEGGFGSTGVSLGHVKIKQFQQDQDYHWKEKTILALYALFQDNKITLEEKQRLGQMTFQGDRRIYEVIEQNPQNLLECLAAID